MRQRRHFLEMRNRGLRAGGLGEKIERGVIVHHRGERHIDIGAAARIALDAALEPENPEDGADEL